MNGSSKEIIEFMITAAQEALRNHDYQKAAVTLQKILELEPHAEAQFALAVLYARGYGVEQNYKEAAYLFNQAVLAGDKEAENYCAKSIMDFITQDMDAKTPERLYGEMTDLVTYIYPDAPVKTETNRKLYALAGLLFNKKDYAPAAKLFRAAAQYGDDGYSQNYLAVLYNAGAGLPQNDLAALYWFDRAADHGVDAALKDRDGILNAYKQNYTADDFYQELTELASRCETGGEDVPKDPEKAERWRKMAESITS